MYKQCKSRTKKEKKDTISEQTQQIYEKLYEETIFIYLLLLNSKRRTYKITKSLFSICEPIYFRLHIHYFVAIVVIVAVVAVCCDYNYYFDYNYCVDILSFVAYDAIDTALQSYQMSMYPLLFASAYLVLAWIFLSQFAIHQ